MRALRFANAVALTLVAAMAVAGAALSVLILVGASITVVGWVR